MPKPPNIIRPVTLGVSLPEDLRAWLDLHLWSEFEGRVPHGAYSKLIQRLLLEYKAGIERVPQETKEDSHVPS